MSDDARRSGRTAIAERLIIVTGKGGVGKSTVAAALGAAAAGRGLRTIVAELAGRSDVARLLGGEAADRLREVELHPGLHHVRIDRQPALEEYLREEVPGPLPAVILSRSRVFGLFVEATPGMDQLLMIGKVWELAQRPRHRRGARPYDLVVLDGPATGQVLGLLGAPRTFSSVARVGPVARQGATIDRMLRDHRSTAVVAVAMPEQLAVSETLGLQAALMEQFGMGLNAVVVNKVFSSPFSPKERVQLEAAPDAFAARSARWLEARARAQHAHLARLRNSVEGVPRATLPFLFKGELERGDIEDLARVVEPLLS
jgi:anion-transporting  ArsA/GET3 family ATPase